MRVKAKTKTKPSPGPRREPWGRTGLRGVYETAAGRYQAKVRVGGRLYQCGTHDTAERAARAVAERLEDPT